MAGTGQVVDSANLASLKWPQPATSVTDPVPLNTMLQALQLLGTDQDRVIAAGSTWKDDTPASLQVIKSGTLGLTKAATKYVAGFGGVVGLLAAVGGALTAFIGDVGEPVTVAIIGGAAILLSSVAIALAMFVKGDLEARGVATAARHAGRAEVAAMFLRATSCCLPATATAPAVASTAAAPAVAPLAAAPGSRRRHWHRHQPARWPCPTSSSSSRRRSPIACRPEPQEAACNR